jgi:uncharacterized protein (TIGR00251 family)
MPAKGLRLKVFVQPRARRTQVVGPHADGIKVEVNAPPVGGAANDAVIALLATALQVSRRALRIVQGAGSRQKIVEVDPAASVTCRRHLEVLLRPVDKGEPRR